MEIVSYGPDYSRSKAAIKTIIEVASEKPEVDALDGADSFDRHVWDMHLFIIASLSFISNVKYIQIHYKNLNLLLANRAYN